MAGKPENTTRAHRAPVNPIDDGLPVDALELKALKRRFLALNQDRLRRVHEALRDRQKDFVDLLPLLFHLNHPMLPGFISTSTPCGISDYSPSKRSVEAGKRLAQSFTYQRRALPRYPVGPTWSEYSAKAARVVSEH